ncbi:MAG: response regulator [Clostridiaceae bacterium]|nr:response regulator [Clostridiaceae bacterium]
MLNVGICDDFPFYCELTEMFIRQYGEKRGVLFNIRQFGSGEELLDMIYKENISFDLLFLDYYMKKLTGLETAKRLRQLELTKSKSPCKIVFVISIDNTFELFSVRPLRVIHKPVSQETINEILDHVLNEKIHSNSYSNPRLKRY